MSDAGDLQRKAEEKAKKKASANFGNYVEALFALNLSYYLVYDKLIPNAHRIVYSDWTNIYSSTSTANKNYSVSQRTNTSRARLDTVVTKVKVDYPKTYAVYLKSDKASGNFDADKTRIINSIIAGIPRIPEVKAIMQKKMELVKNDKEEIIEFDISTVGISRSKADVSFLVKMYRANNPSAFFSKTVKFSLKAGSSTLGTITKKKLIGLITSLLGKQSDAHSMEFYDIPRLTKTLEEGWVDSKEQRNALIEYSIGLIFAKDQDLSFIKFQNVIPQYANRYNAEKLFRERMDAIPRITTVQSGQRIKFVGQSPKAKTKGRDVQLFAIRIDGEGRITFEALTELYSMELGDE